MIRGASFAARHAAARSTVRLCYEARCRVSGSNMNVRRSGARSTKETKRMIEVGKQAPDFERLDQFGRKVSLSQFRGKRHVLLVSYPLDWTPT